MPDIVLQNVDAILADRLARRAASTGRSVEEEAKYLLAQSLDVLWNPIEEARRTRARSGGRILSDSAELIREDRDR